MSEEKELKKCNLEVPEETCAQSDEDVEGYQYCATHEQRCLCDCFGSAVLTVIN